MVVGMANLWSWKQALVPLSAWHWASREIVAPGKLRGPGGAVLEGRCLRH